MEECLPPKRLNGVTSGEDGGRAQLELSFRLLLSGRTDLIAQAINLLPPNTGLNTLNHHGLTALMLAASKNDDQVTTVIISLFFNCSNSTYPKNILNFRCCWMLALTLTLKLQAV